MHTTQTHKAKELRTMTQAEQIVATRRGTGRAGRVFTPKGGVYKRKEKFGAQWD